MPHGDGRLRRPQRGLSRLLLSNQLEPDPPTFGDEPWLYAAAPSEPAADGEAHEIPGPGWQPDPLKEADQRWWDGDNWTSPTRNLA